jgi:predicted tellurium resistance membrane protein TerC
MEILDITMSLLALIVLEIILGIDNLVFLSILTMKLPLSQRRKARRWGLMFAWMMRLMMLAGALFLSKLTTPLVVIDSLSFSARDLFLFLGGAFLIGKATQEIHNEVGEDESSQVVEQSAIVSFHNVVFQVVVMDLVFSLDSVLAAIGLTTHFIVMAVSITFAIIIMLYASDPVSHFIEKHPTIKMLALSFLMLIGTMLVADAFSFHVPRGYIYFAMGFSLSVEALNLLKQTHKKRTKNVSH